MSIADDLGDVYTIWHKEMVVWLRNPIIGIARSAIFGIIFLVVFARAIGGDVSNLPVAVVRLGASPAGDAFIADLFEGPALHMATDTSYAEALSLFRAQKVKAVVVVTTDFPRGVRLLVDGTSPTVRSAIAGRVKQALLARNDAALQEEVLYGYGLDYVDFLVPTAIMMVVAFTGIFAGGIGLLQDREKGSLAATLLAPVRMESILVGKLLSGVTQAVTGGTIALLVAIFIGTGLRTGPAEILMLIVVMTLLGFAVIGASIAIASSVSELQVFLLVFQLFLMPLWILSGGIYPVESQPAYLSWMVPFNPLHYAIDAMRAVMARGVILESIAVDIAYLAFFSSLMVAFATRRFKRQI